MEGAPGSTTQAEFTDHTIPKSLPAHPRASQTLHHQTLTSLLPLISTPALCLLSLPHHPIKHLSIPFPISCTLPPAGFGGLGMNSMVQSRCRHHKPLPYPKPSSHPSAALQSSFPGAHTEESEVTNLTQEKKPHMHCKRGPCTEQLPQSN